jgi:hypothetical protein
MRSLANSTGIIAGDVMYPFGIWRSWAVFVDGGNGTLMAVTFETAGDAREFRRKTFGDCVLSEADAIDFMGGGMGSDAT